MDSHVMFADSFDTLLRDWILRKLYKFSSVVTGQLSGPSGSSRRWNVSVTQCRYSLGWRSLKGRWDGSLHGMLTEDYNCTARRGCCSLYCVWRENVDRYSESCQWFSVPPQNFWWSYMNAAGCWDDLANCELDPVFHVKVECCNAGKKHAGHRDAKKDM